MGGLHRACCCGPQGLCIGPSGEHLPAAFSFVFSAWSACGVCAWHGVNLLHGYTVLASGSPAGPHVIPNAATGQTFDGSRWWHWCLYTTLDTPIMVARFYYYQDEDCETFVHSGDFNVYLSLLLSWTGTPPSVEWWARVRMWSQVNGVALGAPYEAVLRYFQTDLDEDTASLLVGTGQAIGHPGLGFALTNALDWCYCDDANYPDFSVAVKNGTLTVAPE